MPPTRIRPRQTIEFPTGFGLTVDAPTARTYRIVSPLAFTITGLVGLKTSAGSLTVTININGTAVTGLSGLSVTSTPQNPTATAANVVAVGAVITVDISSVSSAADFEFAVTGQLA